MAAATGAMTSSNSAEPLEIRRRYHTIRKLAGDNSLLQAQQSSHGSVLLKVESLVGDDHTIKVSGTTAGSGAGTSGSTKGSVSFFFFFSRYGFFFSRRVLKYVLLLIAYPVRGDHFGWLGWPWFYLTDPSPPFAPPGVVHAPARLPAD